MMRKYKRYTIQDCHRVAEEKGGKCLEEEYVSCNKKMKWQCASGHTWSARFICIVRGGWCSHTDCVVKRRKQTCMEKYGVDNPSKLEEIRERVKSTCMDRYGVENVFQDRVVKDKSVKTRLKKYGVEYCMQSKDLIEKAQQTCLSNHGVRFSMQSDGVREKAKKTMIERYGVDNISKNPHFALKAARSMLNSVVLKHWFSNEEIVCTASYERKIVEYFNANNIDYNWQVQVFLMPDGRTYRPDFYLPDEDLWVEIKGYFRKDAQEKWEWFHSQYPNSELWDKTRLKEIGVI